MLLGDGEQRAQAIGELLEDPQGLQQLVLHAYGNYGRGITVEIDSFSVVSLGGDGNEKYNFCLCFACGIQSCSAHWPLLGPLNERPSLTL